MSSVTCPSPTVKRTRKPATDSHGTCGLTLTIGGTPYRVRPIAADPSMATKAFRLTKPDGIAYDVAETPYGLSCDCPDWTFRHEGQGTCCKHLMAAVACGLLSRPTPPDPGPRGRVPDEFDAPAEPRPRGTTPRAPAPCCDPAEPRPCQPCGGSVSHDANLIDAPEGVPSADDTPTRLIAGPETDAWDAPFDPATLDDDFIGPDEWDAWTDADRWEPNDPGPGDDNGGPQDDGSRLDLEAWVREQADAYRRLGHAAGDLVARVLDTLASEIEVTRAQDVETHLARHLVLTIDPHLGL